MQVYADVHDAKQWAADLDWCRGKALAYPNRFSAAKIGEQAGKGGASNLAGAAVNPLVPALGALGGATSEGLEELGLTDIAQQRVFVKCLDKVTDKDNSALVLEPTP